SGRIGAVVAQDFLLYGKVGYVRTNAKAELQANLVGLGSFSASDDDWYDGVRFGGGIEGMLANNIGVRAEYTYTIYDVPDLFPGVSTDANQHLFRIGAVYYF
ncbi:MAG TPA: outer membrane beta-barrel protein, partial [Kiloniellales bacterium]